MQSEASKTLLCSEPVEDDDEAHPEETRRCYAAALLYRRQGLNVVPKKALKGVSAVKWKLYQGRQVTEDEMVEHFHLYAGGVGFITGAISNRIVLDTDGPEGEAVLAEFEKLHGPIPLTYKVRSGSGRGFHRHFLHPGHRVTTVANTAIKLDIKGDGGFCVLPPSLHKLGGRYEVVNDAQPAPLPDGLLEFIDAKAKEAKGISTQKKVFDADEPISGFDLGANIVPLDPSPPPAETTRSMLELLTSKNFFENRDGIMKDADGRIVKIGWRECGMALKLAYGDEEGFNLWAFTHEDDQARTDAPTQWASFSSVRRPGDVTIGTIIKAARDSGFQSQPASIEKSEKFTGNGFDVFNGRRFAEMFRNELLHVYETCGWLIFDQSQGWVASAPGEEDRAAKKVLQALRDEVADLYREADPEAPIKKLTAHVAHTSKAKNIRAMIEMAKSEPGMTVSVNDFDADPMLLGVKNGVLDLKTGQRMDVSPELLVSKRCNVAYDPRAKAPIFERFIEEIQPEREVRQFLQRFLGSCLTGRVDAEVFIFFYGHGGNGKSKLLEVIAWLLGDYAKKIQTEMLLHHQRNPQGPSPDIVGLKGKRLIYANETEEGRRFAEARVKDLTGGDTLTGRVPFGKADISFFPTHKLIIVGNHKPVVTDTSAGMWRRVALVPFEQTIPEEQRDTHLLDKLKQEGAGILNWLLAGLRAYLLDELQIPTKILAATENYREEQDLLGEFIFDCCITGNACVVKKVDLYSAYTNWAKDSGHRALSKTSLTQRLKERGFSEDAGRRNITGLKLNAEHSLGRNI